MSPRVTVSPEEFKQGAYKRESLEQAINHFDESGYLQLDNAFEPDFIRELQQAYMAEYGQLSESDLEPVSLRVGDRRFMISVDIKAPFDNPKLYANPFLSQLLEMLLGPGFVINSFTAVAAYPGCKAQQLHADHPPLFPVPGLSEHFTPYAVTVAIPLVDLDEKIGTTAMLPRSHKMDWSKLEALDSVKRDLPFARMGSCYMMDYRLFHYGTANESERLRPILYVVFSCPWFIDTANFAKQPPIKLRPINVGNIPPKHLPLFKRVLQSTNSVLSML
jgi:hypothetical protein